MKAPLTFLLAGLLAAPGVLADTLPGADKAFQCTACHGPDGMKHAPGQPAIGGRSSAELTAILQDYQHLRRINPAMQILLLPMSDQDLENVAEYFSLVGKTASAN
ncbi:MAG: c-type cytochrome [Thiobacillus sp.]|nr:c-type cytochrome [Thiobacillus sp.]